VNIEERFLRLLDRSEEGLFLGIITRDGAVLLREASPQDCPGHGEWLKQAPQLDAVNGFSVLARAGQVHAIFRASIVNPPGHDGLLGEQVLARLKELLPMADDAIVFGH
jgi:hypothetical protein